MMLIRLFIEVYYLILNNENAKALRGGGGFTLIYL